MNNNYITAQQAAKKWNISDRRVRVLCREGKILGTVKDGKSYKIPAETTKPADGRSKVLEKKTAVISAVRWLKWENEIVGTIDSTNAVAFTQPKYNEVVSLYTRSAKNWTSEQFTEFLSERVVSRDRRKRHSLCTNLNLRNCQYISFWKRILERILLLTCCDLQFAVSFAPRQSFLSRIFCSSACPPDFLPVFVLPL